MKNYFLLSILFLLPLRLSGQEESAGVPPAMKSEAPILMYRETVAERMCYEAYAEANRHVEETDVVFIGDSVTDLWYAADPGFFEDNGFIGRGIGGQTSIGVLARFRQDAVSLRPKAVVILAGINDIAGNDGEMSPENTLDNLAAMCDIARANGITPLLCSLTPCSRFFWAPEMHPAPEVVSMNGLIKAYAEEAGVEYVDYWTEMAGPDGGMKPGYSDDGCHPTAEGYAVMEEVIMSHISHIIK